MTVRAPSTTLRNDKIPICKGGNGLIIPLGGESEANWPKEIKTLLYLLGLCWLFLGVAIIADVFMGAIEAITAQKRHILVNKKENKWRTVKVWNDTVANLTLLALGSSAPEILLSCIELLKNDMYIGELGAGTIVGSAAFNLLGIAAVCVASVPSPELRYIKDKNVYAVTASFSVFAYIWLLVILMFISEDYVEVWEAALTLIFFPILIVLAYLADIGYFGAKHARCHIVGSDMDKNELRKVVEEIRAEFGDIDDDSLMLVAQQRCISRPSMAAYKRETSVVRGFRTKTDVSIKNYHKIHKAGDVIQVQNKMNGESGCGSEKRQQHLEKMSGAAGMQADPSGVIQIEFAKMAYAVKECTGALDVEVLRKGASLQQPVSVKWKTMDGSAKAGKDYVHGEGALEFAPGESTKTLSISIVDDDQWEHAQDFYIELLGPESAEAGWKLGPADKTMVTIIDDDHPGILSFERDFVECQGTTTDVHEVVRIIRRKGCRGEVSCKYRTENDTAVAPMDYAEAKGELCFKNEETEKTISITIKATGRYEKTERFRLIIEDAQGCTFDETKDGDSRSNTCTIQITANNDANKEVVDKIVVAMVGNLDLAVLGGRKWHEQFAQAIYVGGSAEEQNHAGVYDWIFHVISLPWKLIFALVPPPELANGWLAFFVSLAFIGGLTAIVGDMAELLGCTLELPPIITAITFVAVGTSLPDTFASRTAALHDPYADASIGNITGSNSVNVFLGLGLPWTVGAFFWRITGPTEEWRSRAPPSVVASLDGKAAFVVPSGDLGFSVAIYGGCAALCITLLAIRRKMYGGELGGPFVPKVASSVTLVLLWVGYIAASWLYTELS